MKLSVRIKPGTKHREEVVPADDGSYTIYTKAPAIDGRANQAASELLAKYFGVAKSQVALIRGHTARTKIFEIKH